MCVCQGYVDQVRRMLDITAELAPTADSQLRRRLTVALRNVTLCDLHAAG